MAEEIKSAEVGVRYDLQHGYYILEYNDSDGQPVRVAFTKSELLKIRDDISTALVGRV